MVWQVNAARAQVNRDTYRSYCPPGTPEEELHEKWAAQFLKENRADWELACRTIAGDAGAVPFIWADIEEKLGGLE